MSKWKAGITVIELLAVLVILAILALVLVPTLTGLIERTQINANQANINTLNEATRLYRMGESISGLDVFSGTTTDSERINVLFSTGYLSKLVQPMPPYPLYEWDILEQKWVLGDPMNPIDPPLTDYDFDTVRLTDMVSFGSTIPVGSFTDHGQSLQSSGGLMYIPNPKETYQIFLDAQILSEGTNGGYGILFDTIVTNPSTQSDTGWALQIDRGYTGGEVIIRPRIDGVEQSPVVRFGIRFDALGQWTLTGGVKDNTNPWWTETHTIRMEISVVDPMLSQKKIRVWIDDVFLFEHVYVSDVFGSTAQSNVTGLRTWNGVNVAFYRLNITD